jgi:hypothetical protein
VLLVIRARVVALALLASAAVTSAQTRAGVAPGAYQLQFENAWVRVTRVHYEPHHRLAEHQHPGGPNIYVYLNDGGQVLFKHEHGDSGDMAATRPPTKARAYRLAGARQETHIVENRSDLPSDFLEVGLKIDVNLKTFAGRHESPDGVADLRAIEFETDQIRITRVRCGGPAPCPPIAPSYPALDIAVSSAGETQWVEAGAAVQPTGHGSRTEFLLVEFKSLPLTAR